MPHDRSRPQSRLPRRRPRHPLPAGHQGAAQGNAAAGRQADHPVRRRRGRGLRASTNIILVTGRGKNAIEDHFDVAVELETFLEARGKTEQLAEIRKISNLINVAYVRQGEPLGLGHAVLVTRDLVGDEPFAVILGDDVIDATPPALKQMIEVFEQVGGPVLAVERVPMDQVSQLRRRRLRAASELGTGVYRVTRPGREAAARGGAVGPGDHRPLHPDARHLRRAARRPRATARARFS